MAATTLVQGLILALAEAAERLLVAVVELQQQVATAALAVLPQ
jgi:hypothetical protein